MMEWPKIVFVLTLLPSFIKNQNSSAPGDCPSPTREFHRLGQTRYFIYDKPGLPDKKMDIAWDQAFDICRKLSAESELASSLDKITTNAIISRHFERLADKLKLKETIYWIAGKFDHDEYTYRWTNGNPINYGNFHYQQPQPAGIGGGYIPSSDPQIKSRFWDGEDKCLAFALPFKNNPSLGWQASWTEKTCNSARHRRVLCQSGSGCDEQDSKNPHLLTEDKEYYFTEGNWIFAKRKFIVNWKPRTFEEAKSYCEDFGLILYAPVLGDECLIPYLKMWTPVLSTYHFWTSYKYSAAHDDFRDKDGKIVQSGSPALKKRSGASLSQTPFCVSYVWSFEFKNETRCKHFKCDWAYYMLAPANCKNKIGTICENKEEDNTRFCNFQKNWLRNFQPGLKETAVVEFGYKGSGLWRSTYKQTFGSRICGSTERQMIDSAVEYWNVERDAVEFVYDYEETYWVVNEDLFQHVGSDEELCSVSFVIWDKEELKYSRALKKVSCNEWHFYLCELIA